MREIEGTVAQLRTEVAAATDKPRQARLLYEIGEVEERAGDETGAVKDYLAAFNTEPSFREPLEALVRLLERRRSLKNLGRIVDALLRVAANPQEKARALLAKAAYLEEGGEDLAAARDAVFDATELSAPQAETTQAWIMLERLAAKLDDVAMREQALGERAERAGDRTWKALLRIELAQLRAAKGDVDGALNALEAALEGDTEAIHAALVAMERLARAEPGLADTEQGERTAKALATALEAHATLLHEASLDTARGDALGVPRWMRTPTQMAGAWLRAADALRATGQAHQASQLLDKALAVAGGAEAEERAGLELPLLNGRIRLAELLGDTALAAKLAEQRLRDEPDGGIAAALAMRVAEHAASEGDAQAALAALVGAIARDPACIPARALQLDLLADGGDPAAFAAELEAFAELLTDDEARGRAYLLSAYVWGVRAKDAAEARTALSQAALARVAPVTLARVARTLAAAAGDLEWFEESTRRLIAASAPDAPIAVDGQTDPSAPAKAPSLEIAQAWFEIARAKLARGDRDGGTKALRELGAIDAGGWLGRALEAFLPMNDAASASGGAPAPSDGARRRQALEELAATAGEAGDAELARGLGLVAVMRAQRAGDGDRARELLRALADGYGGDELIASYLADLERAAGDAERAAAATAACAVQTEDAELASALLIEAGLERWRRGDRLGAASAFEEAATRAPRAAKLVLGWATRGTSNGSVEARRAALQRAEDMGLDERLVALDGFATEVSGGSAVDAQRALDALEERASVAGGGGGEISEFEIAASLARLVWPPGSADRAATEGALKRLAAAGTDAVAFAAAERVRLARESDPASVLDTARAWFDAGGGIPAVLEWLGAAADAGDTEPVLAASVALAGELHGAAREQILGHTAVLRQLVEGGSVPFVAGASHVTRLTNLELSPPGCDPRRRAAALRDVDGALGEEAEIDALALAGWSLLAAGEVEGALEAFAKVTAQREADLAAWEGLRLSAEAAEQKETRAVAAEMLGQLSTDDARASEMWEQAGTDWLDLGDHERAEAALDQAFARDPRRPVAFDRLFRRVRDRKDGDKLLDITSRRLEVSEDPPEMCKLYWEQARVLREKGDQDGALKALENVTMLEPDHIGALALTGEIAIRRGLFDEAASALARLSSLQEAPAMNRVTAGVAAVDLYENKLDRHDKALEVLLGLHKAKLSTLPVRERLARAAGRTGAWREATAILEELMMERAESAGRLEAARLAVAIYRDRLGEANGARKAVQKILEEAPDDGEAIDMLLSIDLDTTAKRRLLDRSRHAVLEQVQQRPLDLTLVRRLSNIGRAVGDDGLWQAALSTSLALGEQDPRAGAAMLQLVARKPRQPQIALNEAILRGVLAPGDEGPIAQLFTLLAPTLAEALGPSLAAAGVTKKEKVDPRAGLAVRNEIAAWAGAFGLREFDLYIGGKDPNGVVGVPGEVPSLVIGSQVSAPLQPMVRGRVARELFALLRGSTLARWRDDTTIAAVTVAACNLAEVRIEAPTYAMLGEVERLMSKAISRKTKKLLPDACRAVVQARVDARAWAHRALMSHNRIAVVASGDPAATILDVTGQPIERLPALIAGDSRVEEIVRFVLSPGYLELRRSLGLEAGS